MQDLAEALINRAGWAIENGVAFLRPSPSGWSARVVYARVPGRSYERIHIAVVDPARVARTRFASTVGEAIRVAEARVRGRAIPET